MSEKKRVLIIDDDQGVASFFATVLNFVGLECEIVTSAREALQRLAGSAPDLILLDMRLGSDIGGEDILYQVRSNPRFDHTQVIVITAYPATTDTIANIADLILTKPVEVDQLRSLVDRLGTGQAENLHPAFRDPVTGLFTREFFLTRLELAIERLKRRTEFVFGLAVFQLDLPGQDLVPVEVKTRLLVETAARLRRAVRPTDALARLTYWRFATLHEEMRRPEDIELVVNRLLEKLCEPVEISGKFYSLQAASGLAVNTDYSQPAAKILLEAEHNLEGKLNLPPVL